jgi:hypothetical protein
MYLGPDETAVQIGYLLVNGNRISTATLTDVWPMRNWTRRSE